MSLWDDEKIKISLETMDAETKYKYEKMGNYMYGSIEYENGSTCDGYDSAVQLDLMLRDGLDVDNLTEDERAAYVAVYGLNRLNEYKNDVFFHDRGFHTDTSEAETPARSNGGAEK